MRLSPVSTSPGTVHREHSVSSALVPGSRGTAESCPAASVPEFLQLDLQPWFCRGNHSRAHPLLSCPSLGLATRLRLLAVHSIPHCPPGHPVSSEALVSRWHYSHLTEEKEGHTVCPGWRQCQGQGSAATLCPVSIPPSCGDPGVGAGRGPGARPPTACAESRR